ncbi:MAG: PstS family phosphate ABC transporter substrate-binding protein [Lentimicrobiaceae bacterium]|jgi:phosphate transport system substrate-binding protein|nr:PstS family phosphate ABC transporter substrate-binding protein [Lentimicrobiaceae bacterium]
MIKKYISIVLASIVIGMTFILFIRCGSGGNSKNEGTGKELKGRISISGAFALYPLTVKWAEEFQKIHPDVKIDISAGGAGKGMTDALSQMVDLGMYSKEVSKEEQKKGAWWIAVTKDAVLPTINAKNPLIKDILSKGITKTQFSDIYITGKIKTWGQLYGNASSVKSKINIFNRSDACGAAEMWGKYLGKNQESLLGIGIYGDPGIAEEVKKDPLSIGFNNVIYAYDINTRKKYVGLEILPIDINENGKLDPEENFYSNLDSIMNAIKTGKYPSPPARDLYFVSKGKPTNPLVVEFIHWILTDGQKFVNEAGYVDFPEEKLNKELQKISN